MPATVKIWRMPCQTGIEIVHVADLVDPIPPQVSAAHKLVYFEHGTKGFYYRRRRLMAQTGHLLLIAPGEVHRADALSHSRVALRVLSLPDALLSEAAPVMSMRHPFTPRDLSPFITHPTVICAFQHLHRPLDAFASALEQETALSQLLESLFRHVASSRKPTPASGDEQGPIRRVKQYLEDHSAEDITLTQLAQVAHLAPAYLCRAFAKSVGMPPHAYQIAVRIARARELLRQGYSAGQAALETGFYDQSHLNRHFIRAVRMPPTQYARQVNFVQDSPHH